MTDRKLVSVYIPTFNRLELLQRAIKSVLAQDYKEIEVLVVDDGSTDGTREYLDRIAKDDGRIIVLDKKGKRGAPASRNIAIRSASGFFITGLDDDDYFLKHRVSELVNNYESKYAFLFTRARNYTDCFFSPLCVLTKKVSFNQLAFFNIVGNQIFIETDKIRAAGGFDEEMTAAQDYDTWLALTNRYGMARMIVSDSYVTDTGHGAERITDDKNRKIESYERIKRKYNFNAAQKRSFDIRVLEKKGTLSTADLAKGLDFRSIRYYLSCLKRNI